MSDTAIGAFSTSSSWRRASVNPLTACLLAQYMPWIGRAMSDATLPTVMMAPPRRLRELAATVEP